MAEITRQNLSLSGTSLNYVSASDGGDYFRNNDSTNLFIKNTDASSLTVTIFAQRQCNHGFLHDQEITVAAGEEVVISEMETSRFNDENGDVQIDYNDYTLAEVAVVRY
jgi:hypothetical protein